MNELEKAYEEIERWHLYSEQEGFVSEEEISYLDYIKKHIDNLQSKIDKAIEYIERCNFDNAEILIDMGSEYTYEDGFKDELLDILKENK